MVFRVGGQDDPEKIAQRIERECCGEADPAHYDEIVLRALGRKAIYVAIQVIMIFGQLRNCAMACTVGVEQIPEEDRTLTITVFNVAPVPERFKQYLLVDLIINRVTGGDVISRLTADWLHKFRVDKEEVVLASCDNSSESVRIVTRVALSLCESGCSVCMVPIPGVDSRHGKTIERIRIRVILDEEPSP